MTSQQHGLEVTKASVDQTLPMDATKKQRMKDLGEKVINLGRERDGLVSEQGGLVGQMAGLIAPRDEMAFIAQRDGLAAQRDDLIVEWVRGQVRLNEERASTRDLRKTNQALSQELERTKLELSRPPISTETEKKSLEDRLKKQSEEAAKQSEVVAAKHTLDLEAPEDRLQESNERCRAVKVEDAEDMTKHEESKDQNAALLDIMLGDQKTII
ncbi:MAG: hypothetical protein Q9173_006884 [Seirophora scorigena]